MSSHADGAAAASWQVLPLGIPVTTSALPVVTERAARCWLVVEVSASRRLLGQILDGDTRGLPTGAVGFMTRITHHCWLPLPHRRAKGARQGFSSRAGSFGHAGRF